MVLGIDIYMNQFQTIQHGLKIIQEDIKIGKYLIKYFNILYVKVLIMDLLILLLYLVMEHIEKNVLIYAKQQIKKLK